MFCRFVDGWLVVYWYCRFVEIVYNVRCCRFLSVWLSAIDRNITLNWIFYRERSMTFSVYAGQHFRFNEISLRSRKLVKLCNSIITKIVWVATKPVRLGLGFRFRSLFIAELKFWSCKIDYLLRFTFGWLIILKVVASFCLIVPNYAPIWQHVLTDFGWKLGNVDLLLKRHISAIFRKLHTFTCGHVSVSIYKWTLFKQTQANRRGCSISYCVWPRTACLSICFCDKYPNYPPA